MICHHTDVGGRVPGSNATDSTEIYQEGLRIPPLKLYERGKLERDAGGDDQDQRARAGPRVGRSSAQYAAAQVGKRGLEKLLARYGADEVEAYMGELLDYAERMTRAEIKPWPKGRYEFTDHIDNDGFSDTPIPIKVAITVRDDGTLLVDYTGSSPAGEGRAQLDAQLHAFAHVSQRALRAAEDVPNNVGVFRCIEVKVPEASVLNPVMPAPCAARALTGYRVFDTMLGALAQIVPDRVPAAGEGGNSVVCISGLRHQPQALHHRRHDLRRLGRAARQGRHRGDHQPVAEPLQHAGRGDGGGASGAGRGVRLRARHLRRRQVARRASACGAPTASWRAEALLQLRTDRVVFQPYGLHGGEPGGRSRNFIEIGNRREPLPGKVTMTVPHGRAHRARAGRRRRLRRPRHARSGAGARGRRSTARSRPNSPADITALPRTASDNVVAANERSRKGALKATDRRSSWALCGATALHPRVGHSYRRKKTSTRMPGSRGTLPSRSIRTSMTSTSVARRAPREPMRGSAREGESSTTLPSYSLL